jgi:aldehyde dehydrogenase (NAD+)/aldehyde dehydrogenase
MKRPPHDRPGEGPDALPEHEVVSPVTGNAIDRVRLSTGRDIARLLADSGGPTRAPDRGDVLAFLGRLHDRLGARQDELVETTILETGFIHTDCRDIVAGAIEFVRDFGFYAESQEPDMRPVPHSYGALSGRTMHITHRPYRWVAAMVPQNASLTLSITIIASALYAGSRVLLRPSLQCASSGALLADLVRESAPPAPVVIVNSLASEFLTACYQSDQVDLVHYVGSNRHAMQVLSDTMSAGKICLLDGQGNGVLYVDESFSVAEAVELITSGATRFNGLTCTSVNGALIAERAYPALRDALVAAFGRLVVGDPREPGTQIGPLFNAEHATGLIGDLRPESSARVLCGGLSRGAYFTPAVVEGVELGDALSRQGFFGPALWIHPVAPGQVHAWLRANQFPLSDTVLSTRPDVIEAFALQSRAARVCVNEDPSVESMFEPWGGYPPSGLNPVSTWIDKYRQTYQIDGRSAVLAESFRTLRKRAA